MNVKVISKRKSEIVETEKDNVILFPTWQKEIETKSLQLLQDKKYREALSVMDQLLDYDPQNHEIVVGKLICLIELGRDDEAQSLCEELLRNEDEYYYQYVHLYLTILFQTNQFHLLMERVEYELQDKSIPEVIEEQLQQFYMMSEQMRQDEIHEKTSENIDEFLKEVTANNHMRQWQLIENLRKMEAIPPSLMIDFLVDERVHPVIKTVIFKWLRDSDMSKEVEVYKLDVRVSVKPQDIPEIRRHPIFKQVLLLLRELEHENPSLFILLEQLLYRYLYVRYPMMPQADQSPAVAEALRSIGDRKSVV